ncbi:MAG: LysM peptidoglycan-binding domain-containing protein [bacterium]
MKKARIIGSVVVMGGLMFSAGCGTTHVQTEPVMPVVMPPMEVVPTNDVKVVETKPEPVVESKTYVVKAGDSVSSIAKHFKVPSKDILKLNKITNPNKIRVGQKLTLPGYVDLSAAAPAHKATHKKTGKGSGKASPVVASGDVYVVKSGDMLGGVAVAHKTTSKAIKQLNNLTSDKLQVGQKLKLPKGATAPAVTEGTAPAPAEGVAPAATDAAAPVDASAVSAPAPKSNDVLHVVEPNQDLNSISMMYGVRAEEVIKLNNLSSPDVKAGQTLKIPPPVE